MDVKDDILQVLITGVVRDKCPNLTHKELVRKCFNLLDSKSLNSKYSELYERNAKSYQYRDMIESYIK